MNNFVRDFADGDMSQADLLGGKGANLAEMTRMGLPVPPGFTITTEACRVHLRVGSLPRRWTTRSPRTSGASRQSWAEARRPH